MEKLVIALDICERRLTPLSELLEAKNGVTDELLCPDALWEVLSLSNMDFEKQKMSEQLQGQKWFTGIQKKYADLLESSEEEASDPKLKIYKYVCEVLDKTSKRFPQTSINGTNNMWIVKPGQKSRGRGIAVCKSFPQIISHIKDNKGAKWVV